MLPNPFRTSREEVNAILAGQKKKSREGAGCGSHKQNKHSLDDTTHGKIAFFELVAKATLWKEREVTAPLVNAAPIDPERPISFFNSTITLSSEIEMDTV